MKHLHLFLAIWAVASIARPLSHASGMLIPKDTSVPPLAIKHQRVDIDIKDGVASVNIEQVFKNSVSRDLEAVFVFPLPENAAIGDFAMMINGKRMSGELVEKEKARKIYEDIVRRMQDPGLLEHMGGSLFKVSVYPVPKDGEQKIELSYSQTLSYESGMYNFTYPLKTGEQASRTLEDFTVQVKVNSTVPLKTVYSPSHSVGISRKGEHQAVIGFEEDRSLLDRDFQLYYGISKKEFGVNLLTHAVEGQDGYFMLMLAPTVEPDTNRVVKRDIAFVLDTSGSMAGAKMTQARDALAHCIKRLNPGDRFAVIRFSTDIDALSGELLDVNDANREAALAYVSGLEARGGTAIDAAMEYALDIKRTDSHARPYTVVFLTDGRPTIGETEIDAILDNVGKRAGKGTCVFAFGVGHDVNTTLLDRMAGDHSGTTQYVQPEEDIEVHMSSFYDKISHPVLANPKIVMDAIQSKMQHPRDLPDLFAGQQLTVLGRYSKDGHSAIRLTGDVNGEPREYIFEGAFPKTNGDNLFVPQLWATRRVGFLLDEIRQQGELQELKDEVLALSREFGIMTPYTSYLVLEDDQAYETHGVTRTEAPRKIAAKQAQGFGWSGNASPGGGSALGEPRERNGEEAGRDAGGVAFTAPGQPAAMPTVSRPMPVFEAADDLHEKRQDGGFARRASEAGVIHAPPQSAMDAMKSDTGREAIQVSESIQRYKLSEHRGDDMGPMTKHIENRIFYKLGEVWTDRDYKEGLKTTRLKYASDEYFEYLSKNPRLRRVFALGAQVIVVVDGEAIIVE